MTTFWRGATLPRGRSGVQRLRQSEKSFQAAILRLATLQHWQTYHVFDSRRSAAGFPDLWILRAGVLLVRELKTDTGIVSAAQQDWLDALAACGLDVKVWRPRDWPEVIATLTK